MKEFIKQMLASFTALVVMGLLVTVIGVVSIVGMAVSEGSAPDIKKNSVLVLKLDGSVDERSESSAMDELLGNDTGASSLQDILESIDKAKANDRIKGIYIEAGLGFTPDSHASALAIRNKLEEFKKSGKWIIAYSDRYTQTGYYISSVADQVLLNRHGMLDWHGVAAQPFFVKDALAKIGVKFRISKVGKYKSATEMVAADHMSEPSREQTEAYVNGCWQALLDGVSASRGISKDKLNECADQYYVFADPEDYLKNKFVDKLVYADDARDIVKEKLGLDKDDDINQVSLATMKAQPKPNTKGEEIAVYYACGNVVETSSPFGSASIVGDAVSADLEKLADDDDVKAVVLRVNSPGGSAYASEQIWHAVKKLRERKPVVVSMGGVAASGGYYISCGANYIVAEPITLTGSIGIFAQVPDVSELVSQKLGVKFDEVKTNKNSGFGKPDRPFSEDEMNMVQAFTDRGYQLFLSRVAEGRKMKVADVDSVAQGRVWLGQDALKVKLVDELGGLDKAVAKAAQLAKVEKYHTEAYPAQPDWMEKLMAKAQGDGGSYLDGQLREALGEYYDMFTYLRSYNRLDMLQARMPFQLVIK